MLEIILNRLRGTGDIFKIFSFAITGNVIYAIYIGLVVGLLSFDPLYGFIALSLYILGESMGWGKWVGYLTSDKAPENYDDLEGYDFPYIHKTANLIVNERKNYKLYCQIALGLRGFYWWTPLYLFFAFIGLISYIEAIIIGILLGIAFPIACEIGKRLNYNGKFWIINYSKGWENQELIYGFFQGLFFNYVIITNII